MNFLVDNNEVGAYHTCRSLSEAALGNGITNHNHHDMYSFLYQARHPIPLGPMSAFSGNMIKIGDNVFAKGSFTIVNIFLLVQRVLIQGRGGLRRASVLFKKC